MGEHKWGLVKTLRVTYDSHEGRESMTPEHDHRHLVLEQFEPLIHKSLSQMNVKPHYRDYDDFAQELRLKLLDVYQRFDGQALEEDRYRFIAYAGQALRWTVANLLRKQQDLAEPRGQMNATQLGELHTQSQSHTDIKNQYNLPSFLTEAYPLLSYEEQLALDCCMDGEFSALDIAGILGCSLGKLKNTYQTIADQLFPFKSLLYND